MATCKVSLKILVDKSKKRVLFAEAGKDFVDFLFHILALPVGTVIRLLTNTGMVGSIGNLYGSVEKLSDVYIKSGKKDILLKPKAPALVSKLSFLSPGTSSLNSTPRTFYCCPQLTYDSIPAVPDLDSEDEVYFYSYDKVYNCLDYVAEDPSARCPRCKRFMKQKCTLVISPAGNPIAAAVSAAGSDSKGGFVQGVATYMVMDDLTVKPMSTISSITMLNQFNVKEFGHLEEKVISFGMDEGIKLLRASLHSKKVLTDVFLGDK